MAPFMSGRISKQQAGVSTDAVMVDMFLCRACFLMLFKAKTIDNLPVC
jgi:hypothetical protein